MRPNYSSREHLQKYHEGSTKSASNTSSVPSNGGSVTPNNAKFGKRKWHLELLARRLLAQLPKYMQNTCGELWRESITVRFPCHQAGPSLFGTWEKVEDIKMKHYYFEKV
ncbi:unnamed protein product [Cuscuta epithymum]|uniref:Uncharacterized protein n=1 Tax=Cuscuta epithymum TaxID=186058 RepID=A0AAV0DZF8_9ASTE|nr:unnamed protein product [Cuscuta epithymum]